MRVIDREIYANAPVVLVALEVRHPTSELSQGQWSAFKRKLSDRLPIMKSASLVTMTGSFGPAVAPQLSTEEFPKYFDRASSLAVSLQRDKITIETTRYLHFEDFRDLVVRVVEARHEVSAIDGVERVGLRYIDEIRATHEEDSSSGRWRGWVDDSLLAVNAHVSNLALDPVESQGINVFSVSDDHKIVLRHGSQDGYAVSPDGDLKRTIPSPGPYFLIDIDSFWTPSNGTPAFEEISLRDLCQDLHAPVRAVFESLITEKLRKEVLRNG